jgi:glutathione S-transferase
MGSAKMRNVQVNGAKVNSAAVGNAESGPAAKDVATEYELYYWPTIQGRGEFIRLAFEQAGVAYVDVARLPAKKSKGKLQGMPALMHYLEPGSSGFQPFAPPFLKVGEQVMAQTPNILLYLGSRLGLAPRAEVGRLWAHQLQLTIADFVTEVHDTHHPVGSGLYYEDQLPEAKRRAADFIDNRVPKFFDYFENVLQQNAVNSRARGGAWMVGTRLSYVDLSIFQLIEGMRYAFPNTMVHLEPSYPGLIALRDAVASQPNIAAYLASKRRLPFSTEGIFRHYPELEGQE